MRVTNTSQGTGLGAMIAGAFNNGIYYNGHPSSLNWQDGFVLIDQSATKYLVARDSKGDCVCDMDASNTYAAPGQPALVSATFAAPPPQTTRVEVLVPHFGTFHDVPIS